MSRRVRPGRDLLVGCAMLLAGAQVLGCAASPARRAEPAASRRLLLPPVPESLALRLPTPDVLTGAAPRWPTDDGEALAGHVHAPPVAAPTAAAPDVSQTSAAGAAPEPATADTGAPASFSPAADGVERLPGCIRELDALLSPRPPATLPAWRNVRFERLDYEHFAVRREFAAWFTCPLQRKLHRALGEGERYYFGMVEGIARHVAPTFVVADREAGELPALRPLLAKLVLESALDSNAISRVGAAGPWQFMRPTFEQLLASREAEDLFPLVDDRHDWVLATRAALDLTRDHVAAFAQTRSPLACALMAYNAGAERVKTALALQGRADCRSLKYSSRPQAAYLMPETYSYQARVILILALMHWRGANGWTLPAQDEPPVEYVVGRGPIRLRDLAERSGVELKTLLDLNRRFPLGVTMGSALESARYAYSSFCERGSTPCLPAEVLLDDWRTRSDASAAAPDVQHALWVLAVPAGQRQRIQAAVPTLERLPQRYLERLTGAVRPLLAQLRQGPDNHMYYQVQPGDTVSHLCQRFRVSRQVLRRLNRELFDDNEARSGQPWTIYGEQWLRLPALAQLAGNG